MEDNRIVELYLARDEAAISQTSDKFGAVCILWRTGSSMTVRQRKNAKMTPTCKRGILSRPTNRRTICMLFLPRITRHLSLNCCRKRSRLKRSAFICSFSAEMEQCIPAPDDMECRIDDMALKMRSTDFSEASTKNGETSFTAILVPGFHRFYFQAFSLSESKVKITLFRCRRRFREYLEKGGYTI